MSARQAAVLILPGVLVLLASVPFGLAAAPGHLIAAGVAVGLSVPPAFGTFWLAQWLASRHPLGGVLGMLMGTMARILVAVGGGAAVFFLASGLREMGYAYWLWILAAYLSTLLTETVLLARTSPRAVARSAG